MLLELKSGKQEIKTFLWSMTFTLLIFCLFAGLVIVEKNTRQIAFGDTTPMLFFVNGDTPYINLHFLGNDYKILLEIVKHIKNILHYIQNIGIM